nr:uncharacterized protein LOC104116482 isoform X1 [Nicotiana tomentosiformis]
MSKKLVLLMILVASTLFCGHQAAVVIEATTDTEIVSSVSRSWPFPRCCDSDKQKVKKCMTNTTSIDDCCPTFKSILGRKCPCYRYANYLDNQALITLASYCDVKNPCMCEKQEDMTMAVDSTSSVTWPCPRPRPRPRPRPQRSCCAGDKAKIKTCMTNTTSIDECCPTFKSTIGRSCSCHRYAEQLDNQALITLEAYCDVTNPCDTASPVGDWRK